MPYRVATPALTTVAFAPMVLLSDPAFYVRIAKKKQDRKEIFYLYRSHLVQLKFFKN
jgi:hypothetical protein